MLLGPAADPALRMDAGLKYTPRSIRELSLIADQGERAHKRLRNCSTVIPASARIWRRVPGLKTR